MSYKKLLKILLKGVSSILDLQYGTASQRILWVRKGNLGLGVSLKTSRRRYSQGRKGAREFYFIPTCQSSASVSHLGIWKDPTSEGIWEVLLFLAYRHCIKYGLMQCSYIYLHIYITSLFKQLHVYSWLQS